MADRRTSTALLAPNTTRGGLFVPTAPAAPVVLDPADRSREYVSGDGLFWLEQYVKSLPPYIDDVTYELGDDLYERMANDGVIRGNLNTIKAAILDDGLQLTSAVPDAEQDGHDLAETILDFCRRVVDDLEPSIDHTLWDMLDGLHLGNRLAELVYHPVAVGGAPLLALRSVKVKPRVSYAYALDAYSNLVGVLGLIPGRAYPVLPGQLLIDPQHTPNLLPPEKFAIFTIRPRENDPRGTSLLRACYNAWWQKMQVWPEYLKYLTQFASPLIAGILSATSTPSTARDANGLIIPGRTSNPADNLLASLQALRNGGVIVLPNGTTLDIKQSSGEGKAFLDAFEYHDLQITVAMLSQTLATGAHHANSKAAASVHHDVLTTLVQQLKQMLIRVIRRQILGRMVAYNWGDEAARLLTPDVGLGKTDQPDQPAILTALASIPGFKVYPSQLPGIYALAGLPEADPDEIAQDDAAQQALQRTAEQTGAPSGGPATTGKQVPAPEKTKEAP